MTLFVITSIVLLVTPGPAVLYIVARSIDQGRLAGLASSAGLTCGGLVYVAVASAGLSALVTAWPLALVAIQLAGGVYLFYLGLRTLRSSSPGLSRARRADSLGRIFRDGLIVNLLNPKAAMFMFAFLPQFVDPSRGAVSAQVVKLGLVFVGLGVLTDSSYAMVAGTVGGWLRSSPRWLRVQRAVSAGVYLVLGLSALLSIKEALVPGNALFLQLLP